MGDKIEYFIFINGFWTGFADKTDGITIDMFEKIFAKTILANYKITNNINIANVLFESVFAQTLVDIKDWKYKIFFSGEPYITNEKKYDLLLFSHETQDNIVDIPLYVIFMHDNNLLNRIVDRSNREKITKIPEKFCCFIVSNESCTVRNNMFYYLSQYKKVESSGRFANNTDYVMPHMYWTEDFRDFISNYKFIICFENNKKNTYATEKIVNPYAAQCIPIYWGTTHIHKVFNKESMLFLEDESIESYQNIINKIIELDNSDVKYLEFINRPPVSKMNYFNENYTIDAIATKINNVLLKKQ